MEPLLIIAAGALTRLVSLGIGTFFVFLGYRLFSQVPVGAEGDAEISGLKGATIKLTKIGPGVFFALFGTVIVVWTLGQPIEFKQTTRLADGGQVTQQAGAATGAQAQDGELASQRAMTRQDIEFLNEVSGVISDEQAAGIRHRAEYIVPRIKRLLMEQTWDSKVWGDRAAFRRWLEQTGGLAEPENAQMRAALDFYRAGLAAK